MRPGRRPGDRPLTSRTRPRHYPNGDERLVVSLGGRTSRFCPFRNTHRSSPSGGHPLSRPRRGRPEVPCRPRADRLYPRRGIVPSGNLPYPLFRGSWAARTLGAVRRIPPSGCSLPGELRCCFRRAVERVRNRPHERMMGVGRSLRRKRVAVFSAPRAGGAPELATCRTPGYPTGWRVPRYPCSGRGRPVVDPHVSRRRDRPVSPCALLRKPLFVPELMRWTSCAASAVTRGLLAVVVTSRGVTGIVTAEAWSRRCWGSRDATTGAWNTKRFPRRSSLPGRMDVGRFAEELVFALPGGITRRPRFLPTLPAVPCGGKRLRVPGASWRHLRVGGAVEVRVLRDGGGTRPGGDEKRKMRRKSLTRIA